MPDFAVEAIDVVKRYPFKKSTPKGGRNIFKAMLGLDRADTVALNGASFKVRQGEIFGLLGPNGAGKTTMIKILSTLLTFEGGKIFVNGTDLRKNPNAVLRHLQTVLTGSRGFEWRLTVRESLEFYARLYGMDADQRKRRIDELLEMTGVQEFENNMFQRFSSGMARRVLLARALLQDAPILLFDEPTANLDPNSSVSFRQLIKELSVDRGKTVLLATHNMFEAQELCDTIAIMDKGRVIAQGSPSDIRRLFGGNVKITIGLWFPDEVLQAQVMRSLRESPGISALKVAGSGGECVITLEAALGLDINAVLRTILAESVVLRSLETSYPTLEDAFVALTARGQN